MGILTTQIELCQNSWVERITLTGTLHIPEIYGLDGINLFSVSSSIVVNLTVGYLYYNSY